MLLFIALSTLLLLVVEVVELGQAVVGVLGVY
jgi:hypothetical protein